MVYMESTVYIKCFSTIEPEWSKDGYTVTPYADEIMVEFVSRENVTYGSILIVYVDETDIGVYTCTGMGKEDQPFTATSLLLVAGRNVLLMGG